MRLALHPMVVHFPIALLLLGLLLSILAMRRPDPFYDRAAYGALLLGWWAALAALLTGTLEIVLNWPLPEGTLAWLNAHAASGLILLIVYFVALQRRRRDPRILHGAGRYAYLGLLVAGALLVAFSGWVGGVLVYELGFGDRG